MYVYILFHDVSLFSTTCLKVDFDHINPEQRTEDVIGTPMDLQAPDFVIFAPNFLLSNDLALESLWNPTRKLKDNYKKTCSLVISDIHHLAAPYQN